MLNHVLYYIGVSALVLVGLIVAISAFVSIFASIRNSKAELAELAEQGAAENEGSDAVTDSSNSPNEVGEKEVKEQ